MESSSRALFAPLVQPPSVGPPRTKPTTDSYIRWPKAGHLSPFETARAPPRAGRDDYKAPPDSTGLRNNPDRVVQPAPSCEQLRVAGLCRIPSALRQMREAPCPVWDAAAARPIPCRLRAGTRPFAASGWSIRPHRADARTARRWSRPERLSGAACRSLRILPGIQKIRRSIRGTGAYARSDRIFPVPRAYCFPRLAYRSPRFHEPGRRAFGRGTPATSTQE